MRPDPTLPALPDDAPRSTDILVIAGACAIGAWLVDLFHVAAGAASTPAEVAFGDFVPEDFGRSAGPPRVVMVAAPGRRVIEVASTTRLPIVIALDDPIDSIRFERSAAGTTFFHALREQTRRAAPLPLFRGHPGVLLVRRALDVNAQDLVGQALAHSGLDVGPAALEGLKEQFGGPAHKPWLLEEAFATIGKHHLPLHQITEAVTRDEAALVREALSPLLARVVDAEAPPITWRRHLFLDADTQAETPPPVIDATGGARILCYGPYLNLPAGIWQVRLVLGFSAHLRRAAFRVNMLCGGRVVRRLRIRPSEAGLFECPFVLDHAEPETSLEIQVLTDEGILQGEVSLGHAAFSEVVPNP